MGTAGRKDEEKPMPPDLIQRKDWYSEEREGKEAVHLRLTRACKPTPEKARCG